MDAESAVTACLSGESATDGRRDRLCCIPRLAGDAPLAPAENDIRENDGPERFKGLRVPSLTDWVEELKDALPKSDSGFVLTGDS